MCQFTPSLTQPKKTTTIETICHQNFKFYRAWGFRVSMLRCESNITTPQRKQWSLAIDQAPSRPSATKSSESDMILPTLRDILCRNMVIHIRTCFHVLAEVHVALKRFLPRGLATSLYRQPQPSTVFMTILSQCLSFSLSIDVTYIQGTTRYTILHLSFGCICFVIVFGDVMDEVM